MFSDIERSPSWNSPPLTSVPTPAPSVSATQDLQPLQGSQPQYASTSRPPVQSGWFPLQDAVASESGMSRGPEMYNDTMLPSQQPPQPVPRHSMQQWTSTATEYLAHDVRPRQPQPGHGYSTAVYGHGYHTPPVPDVHTPTSFGWQDARPMAPPAMHSSGLEHLRNVSASSPYDEMHRVHQAVQGMNAMIMGSTARYPTMYGFASPPMRKKNQKEISIGRWTSEEHRVFLKGLEMYQGPAWGEIARMIGTRTSTQVRTHAQKFFTKLARTNQMLPYFENQIQKERSRLIAQGTVIPSQPSVTPTATSAHNYSFSTLSPPRKREYPGLRVSVSYDDQAHALRGPSPSYGTPVQQFDMYKPRLDSTPPEFSTLRKPRPMEYPGMASEHQPVTPYGDQQPSMMGYSSSESYPYWNDVANRPWGPNTQPVELTNTPPVGSSDPDSLPSVTRLLYRGPSPP